MNVIPSAIDDLLILEPRVYEDDRGYFMETYQQDRYRTSGIDRVFVQDNLSFSVKGTLRGLHFQVQRPQAKLIQVIAGEIFDVAVDLRSGSSTFGEWVGVTLSDTNHRQLYIPEGFAHGFCAVSDTVHFMYKCSDVYRPEDENGILWSDPALGIKWPLAHPIISEKDNRLPLLADLPPDQYPLMGATR